MNNERHMASIATLKAYLIGLIESEKVNVSVVISINSIYFLQIFLYYIRIENILMTIIPSGDKVTVDCFCLKKMFSIVALIVYFLKVIILSFFSLYVYICSYIVKYVLYVKWIILLLVIWKMIIEMLITNIILC